MISLGLPIQKGAFSFPDMPSVLTKRRSIKQEAGLPLFRQVKSADGKKTLAWNVAGRRKALPWIKRLVLAVTAKWGLVV